jgi:hypothetical protein
VNLALATLIGALAGLHISTWGMYKDAPHEGFTWPRFFRSTVVGAALGLVAWFPLRWDLAGDPGARFLFFALVYLLERAATEFWKYFIREEDQSKYFIPMQFGMFGVPMKDARKRIAIGVAVAIACVLLFTGIRALEARIAPVPAWLVAVTVGAAFGWISAFGGAWKDAPIEGFETFKFFRSPGVAAAWALLCTVFTPSWAVIAICAEGLTVASIETYKTFFFPHRPRGKFAGKPVLHPEYLRLRKWFVPHYAAIWALVIGHAAWALVAMVR